ncbi:unnamed protein product [Orchesella dallaii]|uniref:Uncharacterized protein n=1 Tax=Orchesella dallaii TaxID=48710 RepID=A0ABP1RFB4_9HEXA
MDQYSISYLNLLAVACGFLIVLITKYGFNDSEQKAEQEDDSFPHRYSHFSSQSGSNSNSFADISEAKVFEINDDLPPPYESPPSYKSVCHPLGNTADLVSYMMYK